MWTRDQMKSALSTGFDTASSLIGCPNNTHLILLAVQLVFRLKP
jgi:hypothetical protein